VTNCIKSTALFFLLIVITSIFSVCLKLGSLNTLPLLNFLTAHLLALCWHTFSHSALPNNTGVPGGELCFILLISFFITYQPAHTKSHSTDSTLYAAHGHIIKAMCQQKIIVHCLFNHSAAFDTIRYFGIVFFPDMA
jgi:hypothetical protein